MKLLSLIIPIVLIVSADAGELGDTIERLPAIRAKALRDTKDLRAGSTTEMVEAAASMRDRLLPHIITLEAALNKKSEAETQAFIKRDLEAIARDADIRGHADGWGGTIVKVESLWAVVRHLEARASWCVWQLMSDTETFDFQAWQTRWTDNSETGADQPAPRFESKLEGDEKKPSNTKKAEENGSDVPSLFQILSRIVLHDDCIVSPEENVFSALYEHLKKQSKHGEVTAPAIDGAEEQALSVEWIFWAWDFETKKQKWHFRQGDRYIDCLSRIASEHGAKRYDRSWGVFFLKKDSNAKGLIFKVTPGDSVTQVHQALNEVGRGPDVFVMEENNVMAISEFVKYLNRSFTNERPVIGDGWVTMAYQFENLSKVQNMRMLSTCGHPSAMNLMELYSISQGVKWHAHQIDDKNKSFVISFEFPN